MRLPVEGEWRDVWYDMPRSDRGGLVGGSDDGST